MRHFILEGRTVKGVDLLTWAEWFETADRGIALDRDTGRGLMISTVFIGLNHNFDEDGEPLIFETMVFGGEFDGYQRRYSTYEQAEAGHDETLTMVDFKNVLESEYVYL